MSKATRIVIGLSVVCALLICLIVGLLIYESARGPVTTDSLKMKSTISDVNDSREIVCWGDSLTEGMGASAAIIKRDTGLELLTGIRTYNFGVSGATSAEIAYMQGGYELEGELEYYAGINESVMREGAQHKGDILIIEMGSNGGWENGYEQLIEQYHAMIDYAGCSQYIIIGDTDDPGFSYAGLDDWPQDRGEGLEETAWEAALREEFGEHFINMRLFLVERGLEVAGLTPTEEDEEYAELGWVSDQLRADWTHLNSYGYYAQAVGVYEKGQELGYWA